MNWKTTPVLGLGLLLLGLLTLAPAPGRAASAVPPARRLGVGMLRCATISPDGTRVLTGGDLGAFLLNAQTGEVIREFFGHSGGVSSVAFARDGKRILTGGGDRTAKMWDAQSGALLRTFSGHTGTVMAVAFSPDGKKALTGSNDCTARLWDTASGGGLFTMKGHTGAVSSIAFSPDGSELLTGSSDKSAILWSAVTGAAIRTYTGHLNYVQAVAFSPDGKKILTGSEDTTALLWDKATGEQLIYYYGSKSAIRAVAFAPDGKSVLTGHVDIRMRLWDTASGTQTRTFTGHGGAINCVSYTANGSRILSASPNDESVRLWDATTTTQVFVYYNHSSAIEAVALSPDRRLALTGGDDRIVRLWDTATGQLVRAYTAPLTKIYFVDFSPDQTQVIAASCNGRIASWNLAQGTPLSSMMGDSYPEYYSTPQGTITPDRKTFLSFSPGVSQISVFDLAAAKLSYWIRPGMGVQSMAVSADSSQVLLGCTDTQARLWSLTGNKLIQTYTGHPNVIDCVGFLAGGTRVFSKDASGGGRIWETATGKPLKTFSKLPATTPITLSPDGSRLVSENQVYELGSGKLVANLANPNLDIQASCFSQDGKYLLTGDIGGLAYLWWVPALNAAGAEWAKYR